MSRTFTLHDYHDYIYMSIPLSNAAFIILSPLKDLSMNMMIIELTPLDTFTFRPLGDELSHDPVGVDCGGGFDVP